MPPKFRKYNKKSPISSKRKYKRKYTGARAVTPAVKKYVAKKLAKISEVKTVVTTLSDLQGGNYAMIKPYAQDLGCGIISLTEAMDNIGQGTGQGDRIGNRITIKRNMFKGYIYAINNTLTGGNPTNVTMYIGRLKAGISTPTNSTIAQMFQAGDTTFSPTDDNRTALYQINKNLWTVFYKRTFKIGGATSTSANSIPANNDYKALVRFSIDVSKYHPRIVNYNDTNNISTNVGLYAWFTIANYNDQVITVGYSPQVQYVAINEVSYTDD